MLADLWSTIPNWVFALLAVADVLLVAGFLIWVLMSKPDSTSAVAWCLLIFFLHFVGVLLFLVFGYQHVRRPLARKKRHRASYQDPPAPQNYSDFTTWVHQQPTQTERRPLAALAEKLGGSPVTDDNQVDFYDSGPPAFEAMVAAIRAAKHHVHLEFFIIHPDSLGQRIIGELVAKAKQGVKVRLLFDAMGTRSLSARFLAPLHEAGGQTCSFLSLSIWRRRFQINMRNHRKLLIVDGELGFIGGLNIGDEYVGLNPYFGFWRDTHLRIRGPAVYDLQRVFVEDWDFSADERIADEDEPLYFKAVPGSAQRNGYPLQIVDSGPDQDYKAIREVFFAAIAKAKRRVWIATPYFVPDSGLLDAVRLAAFSGIDVRILFQKKPDRYMPYFAARYYFPDVMAAGVKVYQYAKGMMHAKVIIVDDDIASVGTANFDNRSMFLNFEVTCLFYSTEAVAVLQEMFERDFAVSELIDPVAFAKRSLASQLLENGCRLFSPVL